MGVLVASNRTVTSSDKDGPQVRNALESLKFGFDIPLSKERNREERGFEKNLRNKIFIGITVGDHDEDLSWLCVDSFGGLKRLIIFKSSVWLIFFILMKA